MFFHMNVRSLVNKFDIFRNFVLQNPLSVFAVTETWLQPLILDSIISIPNYNMIRKDRPSRGGGLALYVPAMLHILNNWPCRFQT